MVKAQQEGTIFQTNTFYIPWIITMHIPSESDFGYKRTKEPGKWKEKDEKKTTLPEWRRGYERYVPEAEGKCLHEKSLVYFIFLVVRWSFGFYWVGEIIGDGKRGKEREDQRQTHNTTPKAASWSFSPLKFAVFSFCIFTNILSVSRSWKIKSSVLLFFTSDFFTFNYIHAEPLIIFMHKS